MGKDGELRATQGLIDVDRALVEQGEGGLQTNGFCWWYFTLEHHQKPGVA